MDEKLVDWGRADWAVIGDLVRFAKVEAESGDIEPWAAVLAELRRSGVHDDEQSAWAVKLYNAFDDFGSAFALMGLWDSPRAWLDAGSKTAFAASLPCGRERRNLRGGLVRRHLDSYALAVQPGEYRTQCGWLREALPRHASPEHGFDALVGYLRGSVWGTGRLAAFEWAEFGGKVLGLPVCSGDGCLWESSGPRESLERMLNRGQSAPSREWLDGAAATMRGHLATEGVDLAWWDFETVICDFNVMRKGRYYPGQHLAMIKEEINSLLPTQREPLRRALRAVIPPQWRDVPPGVNKQLAAAYARTGAMRTPFGKLVA